MAQTPPPPRSTTVVIWRTPCSVPREDAQPPPSSTVAAAGSTALAPTTPPGDAAPPGTFFCLHTRTCASVGGLACQECGTIVSAVVDAVTRPPIMASAAPDGMDGAAGGRPPRETPGARQEWDRHTLCVTDQPLEVLQNAWVIFQQVYSTRGVVTGNKARALVLVSLLYSSRLLHGSNRRNEEYLIQRLAISTRSMNKAFTQMAAVTLPSPTAGTGVV